MYVYCKAAARTCKVGYHSQDRVVVYRHVAQHARPGSVRWNLSRQSRVTCLVFACMMLSVVCLVLGHVSCAQSRVLCSVTCLVLSHVSCAQSRILCSVTCLVLSHVSCACMCHVIGQSLQTLHRDVAEASPCGDARDCAVGLPTCTCLETYTVVLLFSLLTGMLNEEDVHVLVYACAYSNTNIYNNTPICVYMYTCIYVYVYIYIYIYIQLHASALSEQLSSHTCIHAQMQTYMLHSDTRTPSTLSMITGSTCAICLPPTAP